mgnify:CR=1 FL=1
MGVLQHELFYYVNNLCCFIFRQCFGRVIGLQSGSQKEKNMKKVLLVLMLSLMAGQAMAHSGGTDASGCHMDHKTGIYHCH